MRTVMTWVGGIGLGLMVGIAVCTFEHTIAARRRHDRINDELSALRRVYDRNPSMGPQ